MVIVSCGQDLESNHLDLLSTPRIPVAHKRLVGSGFPTQKNIIILLVSGPFQGAEAQSPRLPKKRSPKNFQGIKVSTEKVGSFRELLVWVVR